MKNMNFDAAQDLETSAESQRNRSMGIAAIGVSAILILAKVCGFGEKLVIAHFFGTGADADVYFGVMGIVWSVAFLVKEIVYPSMLPVYSKVCSRSANSSHALFRRICLIAAGMLLAVGILTFLYAPSIIRVMLPGFVASQHTSSLRLLRGLSPGMVALGLMAVMYTFLYAKGRPGLANVGDAIVKLLLLGGLVCLVPILGVRAVSIVVGVAAFSGLLFHLACLPERKYLFRANSDHSTASELGAIGKLMGPLAIGVVFSHVGLLVDNLLASTLPVGQLSHLSYGKKIVDAALLAGPIAITGVVYARVAHFHSMGSAAERNLLISKSVRLLLFLSLPVGCILVGLAQPIVRILLERGQFESASVDGTSRVLAIYALGLVTFALEGFLVLCFCAMENTRTPVVLGVLFVVVDIGIAFLLLPYFQSSAIAAAHVIAKTGKVFLLGYLLRKKLGGLWGDGAGRFMATMAIATSSVILAIGASVKFAGRMYDGPEIVTGFVVPAVLGAASFFVIALLMKSQEASLVLSVASRAMKRIRF